ncbi:MAG TPA: endolytic transglycosylase MltG, partial [Candidatus Acidoferrum sp.]|nr:endolytic transglycosylase MltG [Candidatus Acidoferrum sp.]
VAMVRWYDSALQPLSATAKRISVVIPSGATANSISDQLVAAGVIKNATAFYWYAKLGGQLGNLKAGTYLFSPNQSVAAIVAQIASGKVGTYNLTILPGKTLADIKNELITDGFSAADIDQAFTANYDSPLLKDKPANVNLEGYIFPDTYQIASDTTVQQLLNLTFADFYHRLQSDDLPRRLADKGFNLHQSITLASVIEQEANTTADRRQVAQVFEKRLGLGMPLGSDVTFIYAAKQLGVAPDPTLESPYNTRIHTGLPPGAISNFTLDSLQAVANPAPGDYLYFVAGDDGTMHFANTEAEHNANVAKYCIELCQ